MDKKVPFIIYAESTPNPSTMKFVANKLLMNNGATYESADPNGNEVSPLAHSLFNFSFVKRVFIANNYVTITRTDVIEWEDIVQEVREFIGNFLNNNGIVFEGNEEQNEVVEKNSNSEFTSRTKHREQKSDVEKNIVSILDEYVAPSVESDGGAILFDSYAEKEGKVSLILKGSCSGCPSSTLTLKSGVENLLKQMMPEDVKEVVALNG